MAKSSGEIRFGQHLIQKRLCTLRQVNEGLQALRESRTPLSPRSLGWTLRQKGYLDAESLRQASPIRGSSSSSAAPAGKPTPSLPITPGWSIGAPAAARSW